MQDKKGTLSQILEGAILGIILEFIVDLFFNIFFENEEGIKKDINISNPSAYTAALLSGGLAGYLDGRVDVFASTAITSVFYNYIDIQTNNFTTDDFIKIKPKKIVFDLIISILIIYIIDDEAVADFKQKKEKRLGNIKDEFIYPEDNFSSFSKYHNLFIVILVALLSEVISTVLSDETSSQLEE